LAAAEFCYHAAMPYDTVFAVLVWLAWMGFILWCITRIRYVIDDRHLRVLLFGIMARRIALSDIEKVDTCAPFWNEHWCNTLWPVGRVVRIRRKSGIFRNFIITPKDRDTFIRELKARVPNLSV
jgi:hypothetical protein